mmetsp:Transcript_6511/g.18731  ORF Transcript_6511/g.18731 Transcript_6511/m.18731 type:complete len:363 (+) Transcript_6511:736-1824(+)
MSSTSTWPTAVPAASCTACARSTTARAVYPRSTLLAEPEGGDWLAPLPPVLCSFGAADPAFPEDEAGGCCLWGCCAAADAKDVGGMPGPGKHVFRPLPARGHRCTAPLASRDATSPQCVGSTHRAVTLALCLPYWVPGPPSAMLQARTTSPPAAPRPAVTATSSSSDTATARSFSGKARHCRLITVRSCHARFPPMPPFRCRAAPAAAGVGAGSQSHGSQRTASAPPGCRALPAACVAESCDAEGRLALLRRAWGGTAGGAPLEPLPLDRCTDIAGGVGDGADHPAPFTNSAVCRVCCLFRSKSSACCILAANAAVSAACTSAADGCQPYLTFRASSSVFQLGTRSRAAGRPAVSTASGYRM